VCLFLRKTTVKFSDKQGIFLFNRSKSFFTYSLKLTDFCPLGCHRPIKNINLHAKFSQKPLILSKNIKSKLAYRKNWIVSKITILQNFDSKRFDYSLKLFFSNFLQAQIG